MIDSKISGKINIGELILVDAYILGIYIGRGAGDSVQFYSIYELNDIFENKYRECRISYIHGKNLKRRVCKFLPDLLSEEYKKRYDNALLALEKIKEINNNKKRNK